MWWLTQEQCAWQELNNAAGHELEVSAAGLPCVARLLAGAAAVLQAAAHQGLLRDNGKGLRLLLLAVDVLHLLRYRYSNIVVAFAAVAQHSSCWCGGLPVPCYNACVPAAAVALHPHSSMQWP
jgi:hypothetical protein